MNQDVELKKSSVLGTIVEWVVTAIIAISISLLVRHYVVEPFIVNGASMDPTFSTGQFLLVDRLSYRFTEPSRGDVIVFEYPQNPEKYFIKRIVGLPRETVEMRDGKIFINGSETASLAEPYISSGHTSFDSLSISLGPDQYFVLGDNRLNSSDSRVWGPLDRSLIVGRPFIRVWPPDIWPGEYTTSGIE